MIRTVFFDLDGTVTDSGPGIRNSVAYALEKLGLESQTEEALNRFIGPPLLLSFQTYCGLPLAQARQAVEFYREYFADRGIFENSVYAGVVDLLQQLHQRGVSCVMATAKPEHYAAKILDHFGLTEHFDLLAGATMDESRIEKVQVIAYALEKTGADPAETLMVGDREQDILGAKANGLRSVGVLYGYGDRKELTEAGADFLVRTPPEILQLI